MSKHLVLTKRAGRPRAEDLQKRTEELLSIAEAALIELGYERATLDLISRKAGVSKQTIYAKYGGKPGLLQAVLQRIADRSLGAKFADTDDLSLYDGLFERARTVLNLNQMPASIAITAISVRESQRFPEFRQAMLEAKRLRQQEPLRRYLESFQRRSLIRTVDCDEVASMFLWLLAEDMVNGVAIGEALPRTPDEIDRKAAFVADLISRGLARQHGE